MREMEVQTARLARVWHAAVAAILAATLVIQFVLSTTGTGTTGDEVTAPMRIANYLSFFTILSNILFCTISIMLAIRPTRKEGEWWRVARLGSLIFMTVTGLVYITVLHGLVELEGLAVLTNAGLHYFGPLAAVLGWLLFGPRPQVTWRAIGLAMLVPLAWAVFTLIRGEIVDWYPYPFIDVADNGYGRVLINILLVAALLVAVGAVYLAGDRRLRPTPREPMLTDAGR